MIMDLNITVLYGSETGTAQDVAEQIWKSAKRKGLNSTVSALNDYDIKKIIVERLIVFVVATTGQGDPPANMKKFWQLLLRKNLPLTLLTNVHYAVLGLGDSSYEKFNFAAKKLNKRLLQLGANELLPIGLADDQHDLGLDAVVDSWVQRVWEKITEVFNVPTTDLLHNVDKIIERYDVSIIDPGHEKSMDDMDYSNKNIYAKEATIREVKFGTVIENKRTTSDDHFQDVRLIKFHAEGMKYEPGDILCIRPKNLAEQVKEFFSILQENNVKLFPNTMINVQKNEIKIPIALMGDLYLQEIVEQYWDLNCKPRRSTIQVLSSISTDPLEKEKLCELASADGQDELYNYINRPRRNILEVLADFPHTTSRLNIKILFEIMSPIKHRMFSIASSLNDIINEVHLLVAIVEYKTRLKKPRYGLCSKWLASLQYQDNTMYWIEKGTFKFMHDKPMILIGPGTGVAPFRSLLLDKAALKQNLNNCVLFFGCRYKKKDYHCKEDFERLSRDNDLKVFCAFSRDQEHKVYVQHIIREHNQLCWDLLQNNASIYLAGNSKNMPNNVREEFVNLSKEIGGMTTEEAENFIRQLEKGNRYQTETWA